jgi:Tfp pilus assembly protein PilZ
MSDMGNYASFFAAGMKVGVGIPLPNAETFVDWALIYEIDEDLVILQLSRDQLPVAVTLDVGQIVDLRGGRDDSAYSCRAIIVSEWRGNFIQLRLIGEIVTDELREFYRVDAFLPIKYVVSLEQNPDVIRMEWAERRQKRLDDELLRKQYPWDVTFIAENAELPSEHLHPPEDEEADDQDASWDSIIPLAANISGGGMRIVAHQHFDVGEYVPLEIMVPMPRKIVDAVGKVVFVTPNRSVAGDRESYSVAMKFVCIDERDRDAIVTHISTIQLQRIRQLREHFALRDGIDDLDHEESDRFRWQKNIAYGAVLLAFLVMLFLYFREYTANHPQSVIGEAFESGIRKYLEKMGK